jgi:hypothetical protein
MKSLTFGLTRDSARQAFASANVALYVVAREAAAFRTSHAIAQIELAIPLFIPVVLLWQFRHSLSSYPAPVVNTATFAAAGKGRAL